MEVKVDIAGMVKECINEELCDTISNVHELMNETVSINSRLAEKADIGVASINDQRISYLEEQIHPANMLNSMLRDYKQLEELAIPLLDYCEPRKINVSLPSLRADNFSRELMLKVQKVRKRTRQVL